MQLSEFTEIKKMDEEKRIVYAEVFAPYTLDTYGDVMTPQEIEKMAHAYMRRTDLAQSIDTNHDLQSNGSYPVESYIAKASDEDFVEGAWVLGVKVEDESIWQDIKKGKLNGFSMYGLAMKSAKVREVDLIPSILGKTEDSMGHDHLYFIEMDDDGRVISGRTSMELDHTHDIKSGTATEKSLGHAHRYSM